MQLADLFALRDSGLPPQEFLLTEAQLRSIEIFGEAMPGQGANR